LREKNLDHVSEATQQKDLIELDRKSAASCEVMATTSSARETLKQVHFGILGAA